MRLLPAVALLLLISGCGESAPPAPPLTTEQQVVGTWAGMLQSRFTFQAEGSMRQRVNGLAAVGTWRAEGKTVIVTMSHSNGLPLKEALLQSGVSKTEADRAVKKYTNLKLTLEQGGRTMSSSVPLESNTYTLSKVSD